MIACLAIALLVAPIHAASATDPYQGGWVLWLQWGGSYRRTEEGGVYRPADRFEKISVHDSQGSCENARAAYRPPPGNVYTLCLPETFHPSGPKAK